jgi:hypothetical protein
MSRLGRLASLIAAAILPLAAAAQTPPSGPFGTNPFGRIQPPAGSTQPGQPALPQIGPGPVSCFIVRNMASFEMTGRIVLKSRERWTFKLKKGEARRGCLEGELHRDNKVELVITNFLTMPMFTCYTQIDQPIQVFAHRKDEGWNYSANCR